MLQQVMGELKEALSHEPELQGYATAIAWHPQRAGKMESFELLEDAPMIRVGQFLVIKAGSGD